MIAQGTTSQRNRARMALKILRRGGVGQEGFRAKNPLKTGSERINSERVNHQRLMFTILKPAFVTL
jgi:hypothetical protein